MTVVFRGPADSEVEVEGVVAFEDNCLNIEFEREHWFRKPELMQISIPVDDIDFAEYRKGFIGAKVRVRMLYLDKIKEITWRKGLNVDFVVSRSEREHAEDLVDLIEDEIERRESELDKNQAQGSDD